MEYCLVLVLLFVFMYNVDEPKPVDKGIHLGADLEEMDEEVSRTHEDDGKEVGKHFILLYLAVSQLFTLPHDHRNDNQ